MQRTSSVSKITRNSVNRPTTEEKSPPGVLSDGLNMRVSGEKGRIASDLSKALFAVIQARADVAGVLAAAEEIERNRREHFWRPIGDGERGEALETYRRGWRVYETLYAAAARDRFAEIFGPELDAFEAALATVAEALFDTMNPAPRREPVVMTPAFFDAEGADDE